MATDYILIFNMPESLKISSLSSAHPRLSTAPPTANSSSGHPILPEKEETFQSSRWKWLVIKLQHILAIWKHEFRQKQQEYNDRRHVSESFSTQRSTVDITWCLSKAHPKEREHSCFLAIAKKEVWVILHWTSTQCVSLSLRWHTLV